MKEDTFRYFKGDQVAIPAQSNGAVSQLTKALMNEWTSFGVNVNAITPGYSDTDDTESLRNDSLLSEANYVDGTTLTVDADGKIDIPLKLSQYFGERYIAYW